MKKAGIKVPVKITRQLNGELDLPNLSAVTITKIRKALGEKGAALIVKGDRGAPSVSAKNRPRKAKIKKAAKKKKRK